jgi:NAD(P)-dependent dehydrogenase (short-subunit alcohol dehydrogenase family)
MATDARTAGEFASRSGAALVTGATGGIGSAVARMLVERGAHVAVTFHTNAAAAGSLRAELAGSVVTVHQLDAVDAQAADAVVADVIRTHGALHTVVHAAGPRVPMVHMSRVSSAEFREQMEADAIGFFNVVRPCLEHLRASSGSIVAVTTAATRRFPARDGLSSVPKGAVEALVRALAAEEGRFGVRANTVGPGMLVEGNAAWLMGTGQLDARALDVARGNIPLRRFGHARDIAEAVCFLVSDRAGFISGQHLDVDGGYSV